MSSAQVLNLLEQLPVEEQREVFEQLRHKFDDELTPEKIAEFERRGEELMRNPQSGVPWDQVRAELKDRIKDRSCLAG